ncbi:MAG: hypothetical protein AAFN74_00640 [Myxococcota bacterium]
MAAAFVAAVLAAGGCFNAAMAGDLDFRLNGSGVLFEGDAVEGFRPNNARFRDLVTQLGFVIAPRMSAPADTLGHAGFHVSAMWSGSFVSADEAYWRVTEVGQRGGTPPDLMQTLQLDVRKGLPLSFEVGVNFMWLADSEMFAPGLEIRWALHEGYRMFPDIAIRGAVNHLVGNRDLSLTTVGADLTLSKDLGIADMMSLTPYVGWSLIFINASSRVVDPTPNDDGDVINNFVFDNVNAADNINHRVTAGLRMLYHVVNISVQGEFQVLDDYTSGDGVITITTKLGLDF